MPNVFVIRQMELRDTASFLLSSTARDTLTLTLTLSLSLSLSLSLTLTLTLTLTPTLTLSLSLSLSLTQGGHAPVRPRLQRRVSGGARARRSACCTRARRGRPWADPRPAATSHVRGGEISKRRER